jgi:ATP-binding cassette subfamily B protein
VLLDGMAVETLDHRWLHQAVGLVAQEPVLFRGSIAANIRYSRAAGTHADDATAEVSSLADASLIAG